MKKSSNLDNLINYIESLIFATAHSITLNEIKYVLENSFNTNVEYDAVKEAVERLQNKYADDKYSFGVVEIAGGYAFMTKGAYHNVVGQYLKTMTKKKLSRASLETLAIIAYKQPVTKPEIEEIRGVNSDYSIQKLLEKNLIEIKGRDEGPGRPLIYVTSERFMDYFGLRSMKDLPALKDFEDKNNTVGSPEEE